MMKPIITFRQEEMLSYFVGLGQLGKEVTIDMKIIRDDLGYTTTRGVYGAARRLRDIGALQLHGRARSWERTTWSCHMRPEDFRVVPSPVSKGNPGPRKRHQSVPITEVSKDSEAGAPIKRRGLVRYRGYDGTSAGW